MYPWHLNFKNYYDVLHLNQNACEEVIKASYKALIKKYHPDLHPNNVEYLEIVKELNEAYSVLSDPHLKKIYDEELDHFLPEEKLPQTHLSENYLKKWEEKLRQKEKSLEEKEKYSKKEQSNLYQEDLKNELAEKIYNSNNKEITTLLKDMQKLSPNIQVEILKKVLSFYKLPLENEIELLYFILLRQIQGFSKEIAKAFKYKNLYFVLFQYLLKFNLKEYQLKLSLVAENINFKNIENIFLVYPLLKIYKEWFEEKEFRTMKKNIYKQLKSIARKEQKQALKNILQEYKNVLSYLKE